MALLPIHVPQVEIRKIYRQNQVWNTVVMGVTGHTVIRTHLRNIFLIDIEDGNIIVVSAQIGLNRDIMI